jgi:hypothetical protein
MLVVINLDGRINPATHRHAVHFTILVRDAEREVLLRFDLRVEADNVESLRAIELQRLGGRAFLELQRQYSHADEIAAEVGDAPAKVAARLSESPYPDATKVLPTNRNKTSRSAQAFAPNCRN